MKCPHCPEDDIPEGTKFCPECGGAMVAPTQGATTTASAPVDPALRCPNCGAGPAAIDSDGFCSCGTQRKRPERDHMEVIISPTVAGISDIGKRHNQNEDYMVLASTKDGDMVLVVCDGVSRSQNQQMGSKVGCEAARDTILQKLGAGATDAKEIVTLAIKAGQDAICKVPFDPTKTDQTGAVIDPAQSTIVACLIQSKKVTIGWAGDSRGYWITPKWVYPLTRDDSWLDEMVNSGKLTMEEALKRPEAHAITKSLGASDDGKNPGIEPSTMGMNVAEPGRLMLCSDGFWNYAEDPAVIRKLVDSQPANADALSLARALVNFANQQGGKDNVTVIFACL